MKALKRRYQRHVVGLALIFCLAGGQSLARKKIDIIFLKNGDRVTCEIRKLEKGKLTVKTDSMGTVDIEWADVERVSSSQFFELETSYGVRYFGTMESIADEGKIVVPGPAGQEALDHMSVVFIDQIEDTILDRLRLSLDMGYSYTKSNKQSQLNMGMEARYRTKKHEGSAKYQTSFNDREDTEETARNDLSLSYRRFFARRWFYTGLGSFETNDELSLDLRSLVGGGAGRHLHQTNNLDISALAGLSYSRERFFGQDGQNNAEAIFVVDFSAFKYDSPKLDLSTRFTALPNLTTKGRVRLQFDATLNYEIFNNFFIGLTYYNTYDSKPPSDLAEKLDYAITTTIGWTFNW